MAASANPLLAGEQPGRPEQQDENDQQESHGVAIAGRDVAGAELLDEREDEAADGGARDIAEAAQDDDRERLGSREVAHAWIGHEDRTEQRAGGGRKPR